MNASKILMFLAGFLILAGFIVSIILITTTSNDGSSSPVSVPEPEWIAVGEGINEILTSANGKKWQANANGTSKFGGVGIGYGVAYGTCNGTPLWVAAGSGDNYQILTSTDGLIWQANATGTSTFGAEGIGAQGIAYGLCSGDPLWVAVGNGTDQILTSVDGLNWQANATGTSKFGSGDTGFGYDIAYGTCNDMSLWVAVGNGNTSGDHNILTSTDGLNWQANATGTSNFGDSSAIGYGIAYGTCNGTPLWVAVGQGTHQILTSVDGKDWQDNASGTSKFGDDVLDNGRGIAYGLCNGTSLWVAVGQGTHQILTSVDGKDWQANASGTSKFGSGVNDTGFGVAYGTCNGSPLWVAVGFGTYQILTSMDGKYWQPDASGTSTFEDRGNYVAAKHLLYGMCPNYYTD